MTYSNHIGTKAHFNPRYSGTGRVEYVGIVTASDGVRVMVRQCDSSEIELLRALLVLRAA